MLDLVIMGLEVKKKRGQSDIGKKIFREDSDWTAKEKKRGHGKADGSDIYFFALLQLF